ncbi:MAG: hypothetical protein ABEJ67_06170 [Halanaeroarchaeum sp.]
MSAVVAVFTLVLVGLGLGLLLVFLVRLEREGVEMDRESAERKVRRDRPDDRTESRAETGDARERGRD